MNKYHLGAIITIIIAIFSFKTMFTFCLLLTILAGLLLVIAEYYNKINKNE